MSPNDPKRTSAGPSTIPIWAVTMPRLEPGAGMKRREFFGVLGGAVAAFPLAARAQQHERVRRIGVLSSFAETDQDAQARLTALREGLQALGWTAGRNLQFEVRWFVNDMDLLRRSMQELIALG